MTLCGNISGLLALLATILPVCAAEPSAQSQVVDLLDVDQELRDVAFRNELEGYALGVVNLWHTTDGGNSWTKSQPLDWRPPFTAIALFGETGVIVGDELGTLHFTDDPEFSWTSVSGEGSPIIEIDVVGDDLWVAITGNAILTTHDGGATFQRFEADDSDSLTALDVTDERLMYACYSQQSLLRSTDGGLTWEVRSMLPPGIGFVHDIRFTSADTGFVAGWLPGHLYTTVDGGTTWTEGPSENPISIAISGNGRGAYLTLTYARFTNDGGMNWGDSIDVSERFGNRPPDRQKVVTAGSGSLILLQSGSEFPRGTVSRLDRTSGVRIERHRPAGNPDLSINR